MNFATAMYNNGTITTTENGAFAYNTTGQGDLYDLFTQIGALRNRQTWEIQAKFARAFREDPLLATKMMFYAGDIRLGGLGERGTFRACLRWLAENHPDIVKKNMPLIPHYNRFDSLFCLCGTECEASMWELVAAILTDDMSALKRSTETRHVPVSLLAKWMPSENATSNETRLMARRAIAAMRMRPRTYRKMLSALRKHIGVTERMMSAGEWSKIDYEKVPSYAMHNYSKAFFKHDAVRLEAYLNSVKKGDAKINAGVLYPYNLVEKYFSDSWVGKHVGDCVLASCPNDTVELQWKALPNYITKPINAVVMADVSGSMRGRPMATSIGLATYFAQHNTGWYHNKYMTFTDTPHFVNLPEECSLYEAVNTVAKAGVGYSTNLARAFEEVLRTACANAIHPKDMPEMFVVISDMEIDPYFRPGSRWDFVQTMKARYARYGYKMPKIVMWNVNARKDTYLSMSDDVICVSGQSASTFKTLCASLEGKTGYDLMLDTLNAPAYDRVQI